MDLLLFEDLCVFELVDVEEVVPLHIIIKIIEIFNNAVTPGWLNVSTSSFDEERPAGAFELLLGCTRAPRVGQLHQSA